VKFIQHYGGEVREQWVVQQTRRENALGDHEQTRFPGEAALEPDLPADLAAQHPPPFLGDASGHCARSDTPRLQQDERPRLDERGRDSRGLAGAGRCDEHNGTISPQGVAHARDVWVDGQRGEREKRLVQVGGSAQRAGSGRIPVSAATAATSSAGSTGLARCILKPLRSALARSSERAYAVSAAAGIVAIAGSLDSRIC